VRVSTLTLSSTVPLALLLVACKPEEPEPIATETETGEPSCLDTETPGADVILNTDNDILEFQLSDCVPETIIITSGGITNLTPLSSMREVGRIEIRYCPNLTVLTGLQDLIRVDNFIITGNGVLPTLPNFNELEQIGHLTVSSNAGLTDLGKFPSATLTSLDVSSNDVLTDFSGLETVTVVTGNVTLSDNPLIVDFTGLDNLTSVGGDLTIEDNFGLISFAGLNITNVGGDLSIQTNQDLSECDVMDWVAGVDVGGAIITNANESDLCN
jgi:hypothetical protein